MNAAAASEAATRITFRLPVKDMRNGVMSATTKRMVKPLKTDDALMADSCKSVWFGLFPCL